jgi:hypothetical protein
VLGPGEPEAVHRLRVSAGRLSVWLELCGRRALRDDLRRLRRAASEVRDLDVICARDGGDAWAAALRAQRAGELALLRQGLSAARAGTVLEALALLPEPDPARARAALRRLRRRTLAAGERLAGGEQDPRALHRLRRRLRRLRYALDWLGADTARLRALQDALGEYNNLCIEDQHLERAGAEFDLAARRAAVRAGIAERGAQALQAWRDSQAHIEDL